MNHSDNRTRRGAIGCLIMGKENLCSTGNPPQSPLVEKGGVRKENLCDTVKRAFTLVEMLVVIAIISLLLAVLLPAFATVREKAKVAQTQAQFTALDTGLRVFQQEAAIGGTLPPSSGDNPTPNARQKIKDPDRAGSCTDVRITGAQLLVHAMMGADGLGTPGFKDIGTSGGTPPANGLWSDDTCGQNGSKGLYELDPTSGATRYPRYPSTGAYVDDKMRQHAVSLQNLVDTGKIVGSRPDRILPQDSAKNQAVFLDAWDHPVLYYKASPSSLLMVTDAGKKTPGIFWQEDNSIITGSDSSIAGDAGVDFGAGVINGGFHDLRISKAPLATEEVAKIASTDDSYKYSFARFIIDPTVKTRPTPVRKDSYLLISAGPDARYGTGDDVVNWTKKTD